MICLVRAYNNVMQRMEAMVCHLDPYNVPEVYTLTVVFMCVCGWVCVHVYDRVHMHSQAVACLPRRSILGSANALALAVKFA